MKKMLIIAAATAIGLSFSAQAGERSIAALSDPTEKVAVQRPETIARIMHEQGYSQVRQMRYMNGAYTMRALKAGKGWKTVRVSAASGTPIFN